MPTVAAMRRDIGLLLARVAPEANRSASAELVQPGAASLLVALAGSLSDLTRQTDPDFVHLATDLKSLHACASDLGRGIGDHAGTVRDALQGSQLNGEDGLAARSVEGLQAGMATAARNLASLTDVATALGRLHSQGGQIERIAMILKASGCTFAVESARSEHCQQAFGSFVEELRNLAGKVSTLGDAIGGQSLSAQIRLEQLTGEITGDLAQLRLLTHRSEATVRQTTEQMQQLLDSSCDALQRAETHIARISRHADDVVYHLQFGDIVRQRLEHIVASLEDAAGAVTTSTPNGPAKAAKILDIQLGQLEAMRGDVEATHRQLLEAFNALASESGRLADSIRHLGGKDSSSHADGDLFEDLKSELLRLEELQRQGYRLCEQANETSRQAIESAATLSRHLDQIQEINREMHLQALNAIIKTALLGDEGRTLGVLSTHVHTVFQESSGLVEETTGVLEQVRSHADRTGGTVAARSSGDPSDIQGGMAGIARAHGEFHQITAKALALVERQNDKLREIEERLGFLVALATRLSGFSGEVQRVRSSLPAAEECVVEDDALMSLVRRYTMESERTVHRAITRDASAPLPDTFDRNLPQEDDNLYLFDAPTAPDKAAVEAAAGKKNPSEKPSEFGDNIDLF
jgi:methyl-accepting chemotaxis protein